MLGDDFEAVAVSEALNDTPQTEAFDKQKLSKAGCCCYQDCKGNRKRDPVMDVDGAFCEPDL